MGEAYSKLGDARNAGVAFRKAALEENNPDPAKSLINLGVCFMQLRRPADAAEAYRTAIDFSTNDEERCLLNANLGQAYVASNRMMDAVQAFRAATEGGYRLSSAAAADFERALTASQAYGSRGAGAAPSGFGSGSLDPFDPTGASGEILPSPDTSGFFSIPESELEAAGKGARPRGAHTPLKIVVVIVALLLVAVGGLFFAYVQGMGIPSQEATIDAVFEAANKGTDSSSSWVRGVSPDARLQAMAELQDGDSFEIVAMDRSATESVALVDVKLPQGAVLTYRVSLVREGLGWKVSNIERERHAITDDTYTSALAGPVSADVSTPDPAVTQGEPLPEDQVAAEGVPADGEAPVEGEAPVA